MEVPGHWLGHCLGHGLATGWPRRGPCPALGSIQSFTFAYPEDITL